MSGSANGSINLVGSSSNSGLTDDDTTGTRSTYETAQNGNDDIFPDGVTTNGAISVPGTVTGTANFPLDDDFYAVDLVAGRQYQFDVIGGTLPQPLISLLNQDFTVQLAFSFDGIEGVDHRLFYIPETSGTYFVGVRGNNNTVGTYTLTAADIGAAVPGITISEGSGDAAANTSTSYTIVPGDTFEGELSSASDQDWIKIDLLPSRFYTFELQGVDSDGGTLADPFLILRDAEGVFILQSEDVDGTRDSRVSYFVQDIGPHYINVRTFGDGGGTYRVLTSPNQRNENDPVPNAVIPGITLDEGDSDAAGNTTTSDTLIPGDTFNGSLNASNDQDWISVELTAGTQYTFDLQGAGAGDGSLEDGFLVLRDSDGNFVAQDDDGGAGRDARLIFTPPATANYFITIRTFGDDGGTYSLVTSPEERTEDDGQDDGQGGGDGGGDGGNSGGGGATVPGLTFMEGDNDAAGSTSTTYEIIPGDVFIGELESTTDRDFIRIQLTAGVEYQFDLRGSSTNSGTLPNPVLQLRDANDNLIVQDNNSGTGLNAFIAFTPTESGTYYLSAIRDLLSPIGTYTLRTFPEERTEAIIDGITVDEGDTDAGNSIAAATDTLISGDTFSGTLSSASDQDFIAIDLTAGVEYTFDLQGAATGNGTLADGFLVLRDSNNNFIAQDDNSGLGDDAQIVYAPTSSGTFYISARTFGSEGGTYALVTRPLERTEDDGVNTSSSARLSAAETPIPDEQAVLDDTDLLAALGLADDAGGTSLVASGPTGEQVQVTAFEGGADVQVPGESYVTSADAAEELVILDEAGLA